MHNYLVVDRIFYPKHQQCNFPDSPLLYFMLPLNTLKPVFPLKGILNITIALPNRITF